MIRRYISIIMGCLIISCLFSNSVIAATRGGSGLYKVEKRGKFNAGDVYIKYRYGVDCNTAYVTMESDDVCDLLIEGTATDFWNCEYSLYAVADQAYSTSAKCKNPTFDQMIEIR